ncbi:hydroxymethylbilane synthase [Enterococcus asini]|uniref:hydroxymethylbilane synthase n=1 Tax=Enterococcus asini TaxID=57732 RepID=UPI00288F0F29|nr:hydroxymethylbilane synthase [Enterococcus asini]MDT2757902.1 hydroxymethylbilane synthase [Enterococcus asini]
MKVIKVGTRKSRLAQIQTDQVIARLQDIQPDQEFVKVFIETSGDKDQKTDLALLGGQGLFVKKIQQALLNKEIDLAVHSAKDLMSTEEAGLSLTFSERSSYYDVLIFRDPKMTLATLKAGSRIGTSSRRRRFQLSQVRPDLEVATLRGNIDTRLEKLVQGQYDAIVMAEAGLLRYPLPLKEKNLGMERLAVPAFLPAIGQGVIAIESRSGEMRDLLAEISDEDVTSCIQCERSFLRVFGAGCNVPIAGLAQKEAGHLTFQGMLGTDEGKGYQVEVRGQDPEDLGEKAARKILAQQEEDRRC